jgi:quercetin dioxygenase-like cupin family protein
MRYAAIYVGLLGTGIVAMSAVAQPAQAPSPVTRTVVAATKLPSVIETPLYFSVLQVSIPSRETNTLSAANGILYQLSGATEASVDSEAKMLRAGDGLLLAAGKTASLKAGSDEPSILLYFLLTQAADRNQPAVTAPVTLKELYHTAAPIPDLKGGSYDLNLTRVTFPAQMPLNPPHHRSGAALYYILSGTGTNSIADKTEAKGPGSWIYEPFGLVHRWGNTGDVPFTFLAFNINPEGVAAVLQGEPARGK